jgi:hypothetical protein
LAEAWFGATDIKIAKMTANTMQRPFKYLPKIRGATMIVRSRNYDRIITRSAHQVFCKSSGSFSMGFGSQRCTAAILSGRCPLWVKSRHGDRSAQCLLYPQ